MAELLVLIVVVGLVALGVVALVFRPRADAGHRPDEQGQTTPRSRFPAPGEPAPGRHGRPVAGSREDRHRHGKP